MLDFLYQNKTELKVFFVVWLCVFFIFSPISMGLYLTPKIEKQEAQAWLANVITDAAKWVWDGVTWAWSKIQDWAIAAWNWVKAHITDIIKKALAIALKVALHTVLAQLTNSIIKWIQSDFQGQPGFVTDWQSYLSDAADAAAGRFLNELAGVNLCSSFKPQIQLVFSLPVPEFSTKAACTLEGILENANATIDSFYEDFTSGGWTAWEELNKPKNNAFGAYLMAMDAEYAQKFAEMNKREKESKSGFKPTKQCQGTSKSQYDQNKSNCDAWYTSISDGTADQSVVDAYSAQCSNVSGSGDASNMDPNSSDCSSSIVTAPDGTVEYSVNFAAIAPMKDLQESISNMMGKDGSDYAPYIVAIANALINQLVKDSITGLLGAVQQSDDSGTATADNTLTQYGYTDTSGEYEDIMNDYAIIDEIKSNLEQIDTSNSNSAMQALLSNYQSLATTTTAIKDKQLDTIIDQWSRGAWENVDNDDDGTESVDDDATVSGTSTTTTTIESCSATTGVCSVVAAAPASTDMTNYSKTTTITTTPYTLSHSEIGQAYITKTQTDIVDSRTTNSGNYDINGNQLANYDSSSTSYSLNASPDPSDNQYKCQSVYSSSNITCQIDTDGWDYQSKADNLSNSSSLVSSAVAAADNFKTYAADYDSAFEDDASSSTTATALTNAQTARDDLMAAMNTLLGTSRTALSDLNDDLADYLDDSNVALTSSSNITITASDGTQTTQDAASYFQNYYNDVVTIYNSLSGVTP